MKYKKKFNKDKTKVTITFIDKNKFWDSEKRKTTKKKTFDVVKKEKVYEKIKRIELKKSKNETIDLSGKYIKGLSLCEYRKKYRSNINILETNQKALFDMIDNPKSKVLLKDFNAEGAFFEPGKDKKVDFSHALFDKRASFISAFFGNGYVSFANAHFKKGTVFFWNTHFGKGDFSLEDAEFQKARVCFDSAVFEDGDALFYRVDFGGEFVSFVDAKFGKGEVCFSCSTFKNDEIQFGGATFDKLRFVHAQIYNEWDMRVAKAKEIIFEHVRIYGNINFGPLPNHSKPIKKLILKNTTNYGKIHLDYDEFGLGQAINSQRKTSSHKQKADQFLLFKENFRNLGQYDAEDRAYYWFKYHQIRAEKEFGKDDSLWKKVRKMFAFGFKLLFFEWMGKYGTSPRNVAVSMGAVWLIWALIYFCKFSLIGIESLSSGSFNLINKLGLSMYHSAITFLTIGYGDIYPQGCLRIWSSIEGFFGLFLMAYFTISFARKVLR